MFIFRLSSYLDRYDPYWYSRLMALKAAYIAIILFIANFILKPPLPSLIMILSGAGIILIEMPAINEHRKKDLVYFAYVILILLAVGLFSSYVYLKAYFVIVAAGFAFILYKVLSKAPQLFPIVSIILMLALISLEGFNSGNFFINLNILIFIAEFALITFWAHKLFPAYHNFIWLSSLLRNVESWQEMLQAKPQENTDVRLLFKHFAIAQNTVQLLKPVKCLKLAEEFTNKFSYYQYYLINLMEQEVVKVAEIEEINADLVAFRHAIATQNKMSIVSYGGDMNINLIQHHQLFSQLQLSWNKLCEATSN